MGIRNLKPTTPGSRFASRSDFSEITKSSPEKSLTVALRKTGGRNNNGRITVRHRGGGHRRRYRIIDFKRDKFDIPAKIVSIEYDPNRSANIALLFYEDGEKRYILSPFGVKVGDEVYNGVMPQHRFLSDKEIAQVLTFVRSSFGNEASEIEETLVADLRKEQEESGEPIEPIKVVTE